MQNFANQAVIATENVRLLNELRARTTDLPRPVEELRALSTVSQVANSLRTSNPIESVFATVRHRTVRTKAALSAKTPKQTGQESMRER